MKIAGILGWAAFLVAFAAVVVWFSFFQPYPFEQDLRDRFVDPSSVQIRRVVRKGEGLWCGEVNGRSRAGGYVGFEPFVALEAPGGFKTYVAGDVTDFMPKGCS